MNVLRWLDLRRLVAGIVLAAVFAMAARVPLDADTWWHLAGGRLIWQTGAVPYQDPWSWSIPGRPWIDNGWLWQVLIYGLYARFSYAGLVVLVALAATAAFACVYAQMEGSPFVRAGVVVLAAAAAAPVWSARPQMGTFVLFALSDYLLDRFVRRGEVRALWLLPALAVLWVNLHAGFVALYFLLGCAWLGLALDGRARQAWPLVATGVVALLVVPLNPYGPAMWTYPFYNAGQAFARAYIAEWASPDFHSTNTQPFLLLMLAAIAALALGRRRASAVDLVTLVVFAALALQAERAIGLFCLAAAPVVMRGSGERGTGSGGDLTHQSPSQKGEGVRVPAPRSPLPAPHLALFNWLLLLLVVAAALIKAALPMSPRVNEEALRAMGLPVAAGEWLARERPNGRLFNAYDWGGYLIWTNYPPRQVFIDGRADLYGDTFLFAYADLAAARGDWRGTLARDGVDTVLIEPNSPLARALADEPGWRLAYGGEGEPAVVFVREPAPVISISWSWRADSGRRPRE